MVFCLTPGKDSLHAADATQHKSFLAQLADASCITRMPTSPFLAHILHTFGAATPRQHPRSGFFAAGQFQMRGLWRHEIPDFRLCTPLEQIIPGLSSVIPVRLQALFPSAEPHAAQCRAQLCALINLIKFAGKFAPRMKFRIIKCTVGSHTGSGPRPRLRGSWIISAGQPPKCLRPGGAPPAQQLFKPASCSSRRGASAKAGNCPKTLCATRALALACNLARPPPDFKLLCPWARSPLLCWGRSNGQ